MEEHGKVRTGRRQGVAVTEKRNDYELAFESWLRDYGVQHAAVDQQRRQEFARGRLKSFDFILYPAFGGPYIAEVKGRRFRGKSLAGTRGMDCWITLDDVRGLSRWEDAFGQGFSALLVFAFRLDNAAADPDGRCVHVYDRRGYVFYGVPLEEYCRRMKRRSPKWQTVTLSADDFRAAARPIEEILLVQTLDDIQGQGRLF